MRRQLALAGMALLGTSIRTCLFLTGLHDLLLDYPDYTTPLSSIRSAKEAIHLASTGHSPYAGDIFHGSPFLLLLLRPLIPSESQPTLLLHIFFLLIDLCIGALLYFATRAFQRLEERRYKEEVAMMEKHRVGLAERKYISEELNKVDFRNGLTIRDGGLSEDTLPMTVFGFYFLNPFTILGCVAMNTNAIAQGLTAAAVWAACECQPTMAGGLVAIAAAFQPSNAVLVFPMMMLRCQGKGWGGKVDSWLAAMAFVAVGTGMMWMAMEMTGMDCREVLYHAHLRMCSVPDLRPNVGVWWYFFTETFERFQEYFLLIFNVHPYVYVAPLSLNLAHRPIFLAQILYCIFSIFVPYPDMPGIAFALCMLMMHPLSLIRVKGLFVLLVGIAVPSILMPLMWHMWIYAGTGNANFYYFQNLIFLMSVCLLVAQVLKATVQRDKLLKAFRKRKKA